jgi:hypothetical protein
MTRSHLWAGTALAFILLGAQPALARTLCVGSRPGCAPTLQTAVTEARDGDTISLGAGTVRGGVTITRNIRIEGAGAGSTIISGGGPVLEIGTFGADTEPRVAIDGVTISGGVTRTSPESLPFTDADGVFAVGGGVEIPPNADFSGGATVTITRSRITGNRVAPRATVPSGGVACGDEECPFAYAGGGGIDNWGDLVVADSTIDGNRIGTAAGLGSLASDVNGAGINSFGGSLRLRDVDLRDNHATAAGPNARFAEGGGLKIDAGDPVVIAGSRIIGNTAALSAQLPASVDLLGVGGAMNVGSDVGAFTLTDTVVSGNTASMTNSAGDATAFGGGVNLGVDIDATIRRVAITANTSSARSSAGDAEADTAGGAFIGTTADTVFSGNHVEAVSTTGDAEASAGAGLALGEFVRTRVDHNTVTARAPHGHASAFGAGYVIDEGGASVRDSIITANAAAASGLDHVAHGGGIYDGPLSYGNGGPLTILRTPIVANAPDNCFGCTATRHSQPHPADQSSSSAKDFSKGTVAGRGRVSTASRNTSGRL